MSKFKEYLRFPEIEKAMEYISVLEKHNIPFELDDASQHFNVVLASNPMESHFTIKLKEEDWERADKVLDQEIEKEVKETPPDHYLYTFSDNDITEIIANQDDWTKAEVKLALEIAKQRKIELSSQVIKGAKRVKKETPQFRSTIQGTASLFWIVAAFSIANSIFLRKNINLHLPGLVIADVFEYADHMAGSGGKLGLILCLIVSSVFFLFARYGKQNKWVFLSGLIIYFLDSLLLIPDADERWGQIIFIFIVLWRMITGLVNTFKDDVKLHSQITDNAEPKD